MRYRIETVSIPETSGIAQPGTPNDQPRELSGRRIIHVFDDGKPTGAGTVSLRVLTEQPSSTGDSLFGPATPMLETSPL